MSLNSTSDFWEKTKRIFNLNQRTCILLSFLSLSILSGCSRKTVDVSLPYDTPEEFSVIGEEEMPDKWWTAFQDSTLNALVDTALNNNLTLQNFWYQLQEAEAVVKRESSSFFPDIDANLQGAVSRPEPDFVGGENIQVGLSSRYELDLWGRIRYAVHAEQYRMDASYYDYRTAAITLSSEITRTWFQLITERQRLILIEKQIRTNEKILKLLRARFGSGQIRGVDILRQEQLLKSTQAQKFDIETAIAILENQLAILIGRVPGEDFSPLPDSLPVLPALPSTGVPLDLVKRRPDVRAAYSRLNAADREVASAFSSKFPRLSVDITAAVRSNTFGNLLQSLAFSFAGNLLAPIFYGGRLSAEVDRTKAVKEQMLLQYGESVLTAFQEVENALVREQKQKETIAVLQEQLELANQAYQQLRVQFFNGTSDYLDALTALDEAQQLERNLLQAKMNLFEFRISLYRALAGGFQTIREQQDEKYSE